MVILHIANIDKSIIGGVQIAVPQMIFAQSHYATVGLFNLNGTEIPGIPMVHAGAFSIDLLSPPFNKPDLVIFHEIYRIEYIRIYRMLECMNIPYIIIPHGGLTKQAQQKKALKKIVANQLLFNKFIYSAEAIQYLSRKEESTSIFKLKSFVSGNGIRIPKHTDKIFSETGIRFLYIGRLEIEIKGLDLLIHAVAQSKDLFEKENCKLLIFGPDYNSAHNRLKEMIKDADLDKIVVLNHEIIGEDKVNELLSADYFIQTSRSEGMPMGILEALSYGVPCIVSKGTGLADTIEKNNAGYGCDVSILGIQNAIKRGIDNRNELSSKSIAAINLSIKEFNRDVIAAETIDTYKKIICDLKR